MSSVITGAEIFLPLADLLNVEEELARLDKELAKWQKNWTWLVRNSLTNASSPTLNQKLSKRKDKQADYQAKYDVTVARIDEMKKLVK